MINNKKEDQTKLQVTVETKLRDDFEEAVKPLDLSNAVRLMMKEIVDGEISLGVKNQTTRNNKYPHISYVSNDEQIEIEGELEDMSVNDNKVANSKIVEL